MEVATLSLTPPGFDAWQLTEPARATWMGTTHGTAFLSLDSPSGRLRVEAALGAEEWVQVSQVASGLTRSFQSGKPVIAAEGTAAAAQRDGRRRLTTGRYLSVAAAASGTHKRAAGSRKRKTAKKNAKKEAAREKAAVEAAQARLDAERAAFELQ